MKPRRRAIGTVFIVIIIVIVMAIGTIGFVAYNSPSTQSRTLSSTSSTSSEPSASSTATSTSYSTGAASGLDLQITLNSTTVKSGSPLMAQVSLFNTLATNVSLPADYSTNPNIANWDAYDSLCGLSSTDDIAGYALFEGHYTAGNISQAGTPMLLAPPVAIGCPNRFYNQAYVQNVEFAPDSDLATLSTNASFTSVFKAFTINASLNVTTESCIASPYQESGASTEDGTTTASSGTELALSCGSNGADALKGYWTPAGPNGATIGIDGATNSTIEAGLNGLYGNFFHQMSPGLYTMVAEDMWNQTVYAHFQILPSQTTTTTQACDLSVTTPGVSVVTSDGVQICVVGPSIVVNPDGMVDFRNGTVVDLQANLTGAATIGDGGSGGRNDTVILPNGTRFIFNGRGVIETISPYQGTAVYSNGTIVNFAICQYPFDADLQLGGGLSGNGTAWWTSSSGTVVSFYPNGSCSES